MAGSPQSDAPPQEGLETISFPLQDGEVPPRPARDVNRVEKMHALLLVEGHLLLVDEELRLVERSASKTSAVERTSAGNDRSESRSENASTSDCLLSEVNAAETLPSYEKRIAIHAEGDNLGSSAYVGLVCDDVVSHIDNEDSPVNTAAKCVSFKSEADMSVHWMP